MLHYGSYRNITPFFMGFPGGIIMTLILLAIITGLLIVIFRKGKSLNKSDTALDILRTLYAKGDITVEEFENRLSILSSK